MKNVMTILSAILLAGFAFGFVAFMVMAGTILAPMAAVLFVAFLIYIIIYEEDD